MYGLTDREMALLKRLSTPEKIQRFLNDIPYNTEPRGDTYRSPRRVIRDRTAHCAEAAFFAAAAFRVNGRPPLVLDLEAVRDTDHVIAVFKERGAWGAVGTSRFAPLRYRAPVYRTLRELAMSYFDAYYNFAGERTLRAYSRPISLARFDEIGWMTAEGDLWAVVEHLGVVRHTPLLTPAMAKRLPRVDRRLFASGLLGAPKRHASR